VDIDQLHGMFINRKRKENKDREPDFFF